MLFFLGLRWWDLKVLIYHSLPSPHLNSKKLLDHTSHGSLAQTPCPDLLLTASTFIFRRVHVDKLHGPCHQRKPLICPLPITLKTEQSQKYLSGLKSSLWSGSDKFPGNFLHLLSWWRTLIDHTDFIFASLVLRTLPSNNTCWGSWNAGMFGPLACCRVRLLETGPTQEKHWLQNSFLSMWKTVKSHQLCWTSNFDD